MKMKKRPFQVYLDPRDRSLLERLARQVGLTKAETVREAVRRWAIEAGAERSLDGELLLGKGLEVHAHLTTLGSV